MKKIICFILITVFGLSSCGKKETPPVEEVYEPPQEMVVAPEDSTEEKYSEFVDSISSRVTAFSPNSGWGIHVYGDDYTHIENSNKCSSASVIKIFIME